MYLAGVGSASRLAPADAWVLHASGTRPNWSPKSRHHSATTRVPRSAGAITSTIPPHHTPVSLAPWGLNVPIPASSRSAVPRSAWAAIV